MVNKVFEEQYESIMGKKKYQCQRIAGTLSVSFMKKTIHYIVRYVSDSLKIIGS